MRWLLWVAAVLALASTNAEPRDTAESKDLYMLHCGGCHLADGRGAPPEVPGIQNILGQFVQVDGGRAYLVQVPGAAQAPIPDSELTQILNYILAEFNHETLPATFKPLTLAEVTQARSQALNDPLARRRVLMDKIEHLTPHK